MGSAEIQAQALAFMNAFKERWEAVGGNKAQLHQFFKDHLEDLNDDLLTALPLIFDEWINGQNPNDPQSVASLLIAFDNAIWDFPLGNRALNMELSIVACELTLKAIHRESSPSQWASVQNSLGINYSERIRGERADNIEQAIAFYERALQMITRDAFPQDWAMTQNNLGLTYKNRIRGERAENIEQAIAAYEQALQVYTREAFPQAWATTQNNLGLAYKARIRGERAENIEQAIAAYERALQVRTREAFPQDWAQTQSNLGEAYIDRIQGERVENIKQAISACKAALQVYSRAASPKNWAVTQHNLGNAYRESSQGQRLETLEKAIAAYEKAAQVFTQESLPEQWAENQGYLISALLERVKLTHDQAALDQAITTLEDAGNVASVGTDSYIWIYRTLGVALDYRYSLRQDTNDLLQAISAYQQAAAVTPWAQDKLDYLEKAGDSLYQLGVALTQDGQWYDGLAHLEASLDTYRQAQNRLGRADALQQIARTHYLMGNFDKARMYFRDALRLYQAEENQPGEAACRAGLGRLLLRLNFVDDAIAELNQACDQYRALGDDTRLATVQDTYELAQKVKERQPL